MATERRLRADGAASRRKILDAAAAVAGERGYEGTSISQVSERSGLPSSSIYWHFADKDALIEAVVVDSFDRWIASLTEHLGDDPSPAQLVESPVAAMVNFPDFLRLGLMLVLEHRPEEPSARRRFLEIRRLVQARVREAQAIAQPHLDEDQLAVFAGLVMALVDGYFLAAEAGEIDLADAAHVIAEVSATAASVLFATEAERSRQRPGR